MEVRYYPDTDTAYVYLLGSEERAKVDESEEVAPGVVVDFDADERPVGIEIYQGARAKLAGAPLDENEAERLRREERGRVLGGIDLRMRQAMEQIMRSMTAEMLSDPEAPDPEAPDPGAVWRTWKAENA